jgi:hypothetical protein
MPITSAEAARKKVVKLETKKPSLSPRSRPEAGSIRTLLAGPAASFESLAFVDPDLATLITVAGTADVVVDPDLASGIVE